MCSDRAFLCKIFLKFNLTENKEMARVVPRATTGLFCAIFVGKWIVSSIKYSCGCTTCSDGAFLCKFFQEVGELKNYNKRSRKDLSESLDETSLTEFTVNAHEANIDAKDAVDQIRSILAHDFSKNISADSVAKVMKLVGSLTRIVTYIALNNAYQAGKVEGTKSERQSISRKLNQILDEGERKKTQTFAQVAGKTAKSLIFAITGMPKNVPQLSQTAVIKPPEADKSEISEETENKIMGLVDPGTSKLKIKGSRLRKDGGIGIETATAADLKRIIDNVGVGSCGEYIKPEQGHTSRRNN